MKLLNHIFKLHFRARQPWSHFKINKLRERPYFGQIYAKHLVWGKVSLLWGQPHLVPIQIHSGCGAEAIDIGEDGISYCIECEHICEGETEYITTEEYEK